uniref:Uncharacterized protein n=1 Tax=Glossina palpalis gambiensis TaxID=67801 RepID=A0A1B0C751_9MUSC
MDRRPQPKKVQWSGRRESFGEAASADTAAAERYPEEFANLVADGAYKPEQDFNADKTALFWKRMPNKTSIKDRVTLVLYFNAFGDYGLITGMFASSVSSTSQDYPMLSNQKILCYRKL